ncbi:hypothetical protein C9975_08270 [Thalassospira xiamenensis]|nr:hypothetical protein C9975_08270 [Thalassospira xiamenensis]
MGLQRWLLTKPFHIIPAWSLGMDERTFIGMVEAGEPLIQKAIDAMRLLAESLFQAVSDYKLHVVAKARGKDLPPLHSAGFINSAPCLRTFLTTEPNRYHANTSDSPSSKVEGYLLGMCVRCSQVRHAPARLGKVRRMSTMLLEILAVKTPPYGGVGLYLYDKYSFLAEARSSGEADLRYFSKLRGRFASRSF